jgi:hypothetical protein
MYNSIANSHKCGFRLGVKELCVGDGPGWCASGSRGNRERQRDDTPKHGYHAGSTDVRCSCRCSGVEGHATARRGHVLQRGALITCSFFTLESASASLSHTYKNDPFSYILYAIYLKLPLLLGHSKSPEVTLWNVNSSPWSPWSPSTRVRSQQGSLFSLVSITLIAVAQTQSGT